LRWLDIQIYKFSIIKRIHEGSEREQQWRVFIGRFTTKVEAEAFGQEVSLKEGVGDFLIVRRG